jgi:hypothetical protein
MTRILKALAAFILGCIALLLFYYYVSIPIIPCITAYIVSTAFSDNKFSKLRVSLILLFGLLAIFLYGINTLGTIKYYPEYGNIFSIIFDCLTIIAFVGATVVNITLQNSLKIIGRINDSKI